MKNYSSNRVQKGKTAYRTPSRFKVKKSLFDKNKSLLRDNKFTGVSNFYSN